MDVEEARQSTQHARTEGRRQEILDAALNCFVENGFDGTSLRQIAGRANLTHAGLLHHFGSKEALVAALLRRRDEQDSHLASQVTQETDGHPGRAPALFAILGRNRATPGEMRFWGELCAAASRPDHPSRTYYTARYDGLRAAMRDAFQRRAEAGGLNEGVDPELIAILLPAVLDGLQSQWLLDRKVPMDRALDHFLSLFLKPGATLESPTPKLEAVRSVSQARQTAATVASNRQQRILGAAVELFTGKGFGGTSISDIAVEAGCSKASVLYHFATKEDLLRAALRPLDAALERLAAKLLPVQPAMRASSGVPELVQICVQHRSLMALTAMLPSSAYGGNHLAVWANGTVVEMLGGSLRADEAGVAEFAVAGIPAFCRQSAALPDEMLRRHLTAALGVLLRN